MMKLFTDEAQGLRVDPLVVLISAVGFIFSVIMHACFAKITGKFSSLRGWMVIFQHDERNSELIRTK